MKINKPNKEKYLFEKGKIDSYYNKYTGIMTIRYNTEIKVSPINLPINKIIIDK